jgi:hypothetical protein
MDMDRIEADLWRFNVAKVTFVDVTEDYTTMLDPLPSACYPVVREVWLPRYRLTELLSDGKCLEGYLYDWHEPPDEARDEDPHWYVGVVSEAALQMRTE